MNILPSTVESLGDPHFEFPPRGESNTRDGKLALARAHAARAMRDGIAFAPAMQTWPQLRKAFEDGIKSALLDGKDVSATLADIEQEWNLILSNAPPVAIEVVPMPAPVAP